MKEFMQSLPGILVIVFLFGSGVIISTVKVIAVNWRKARQSEHLAALKQTLAERGMSAEDIERVVNAGAKSDEGSKSELVTPHE